jgi:aminocarboxymuconate-semialdehyde decarboxylase
LKTESIDLFCHCLPPRYCDAVDRLRERPFLMFDRARRMPVMADLGARFQVMDRFPGYRQVPCLASPPIDVIAGPDVTPELARIGNDEVAEMVARHPDRFPSFVATLPMNNPEAASAEAERAVRDLGAAGVQVFSNVRGRPLDEPAHLAVFEAMHRLRRPVWLHPARPITRPDYTNEELSKFDLWWALGWPHETAVAMGRLVFAGLFDHLADLVVITHHAGGTVPMMAGRLGPGLDQLGSRIAPGQEHAVETSLAERPLDAFKRFWADTATFGSRAAIECGAAFFGLEQMVFATDMPFDPEGGPGYIQGTLEAVDRMDLTDAERHDLLVGRAERLLKRGG